jgi:hypothetical protein
MYAMFCVEAKNIYAWSNTPLGQVKVVIIGQDPYHGTGQAHGGRAVPSPPPGSDVAAASRFMLLRSVRSSYTPILEECKIRLDKSIAAHV